MYADIVVLTYQAPDIDYFTYKIPDNLKVKIGQLVEVPFGKRSPTGIVLSTSTEVRNSKLEIRNLKEVSKVISSDPILLPYQVDLLRWMSNYYLATMVNCLEVMIPKIPPQKARPFATDIPKLRPGLSHEPQSLILVPTINRIPETLAKFPKAKNYAVYHNELKPAGKFATWMKILSDDADYVFGSRSAIFSPCPNLKEIIIYDEHDGAYKDERSPYFDTLTVAQKIAALTRAELKIVDPSPRITTYFALKSRIKIQNFSQKTTVINMLNERQSQRHSPISFDLEEEIKNILEKEGRVFLFLNKKKESGHMFCKACKNSEFLQKQPETCPNCNSADIFWNVLNIESLAAEVKKLFSKTQVNLIFQKQSAVSSQQLTIDIGTAYSLYAPLLKKYDLVAHIQTDSLINIVDFNSQEKLYSQITTLKKLLKPTGKLFLQTYNPQNPAIEFASNGNYGAFFTGELSQRKQLFYPPFGMLFKLTVKGKNKQKILKEAENLASQLRSTINDSRLTILGPYESVFVQKTPSCHIICKYSLKTYNLQEREKAVQYFKSISSLPKNWQLVVEPDSIN